jgi:hypothetical protein
MKRKPASSLPFSLSLFFFSILSLFVSCTGKTNSVPSGIIPKDKMVEVLVDIHLAEAAADNRGLTKPEINLMMASKYDTIFLKHKTTFKQFKSSYEYYMNHPDMFSDIYSEVVNKLTTMVSKVKNDRKMKPPPIQKRDSLP